MRSHNVEYEIWQRITENTRHPLKKWYLNLLTRRLRRFETGQFPHYDLLAAITARDLDTYRRVGFRGEGISIPIGIQKEHYHADYAAFRRKPSISFIGSLDWMPNLEGLQWFLNEIWGYVRQRHPELEFHIAGRNTPEHLLRLKVPGVIVHGEVEDAKAFINMHPIMVVPLKSGSGMRVKILESMALGRVTISTQLGMEGIHALAGKELFVADTKANFLEKIDFCIQHWTVMEKMGHSAEQFIWREFDNLAIAGKLLEAYPRH
jgi:glycosyltransferase involved in cell wall biosynthesis